MRAYVIADADDGDPGFVGARLVDHGFELSYLDRDDLPDRVLLDDVGLLLLLGSVRSACADDQRDVVEAESGLVRDVLSAGTPVMGICYGGQLLARALGGSVQRAETAEFGWHRVDSVDPRLCPPGPWAQFHGDSFVPAPTSRVLGTSAAGCQGYADKSMKGRAIGWQFHPEVGGIRFAEWVDEVEAFCLERGGDPDDLRRQAASYADSGRKRAYDLIDSAIGWLSVRPPH
ncbi:gamma-glutamyl-gamma-aminobutyrate hydrolase family protein [Nocardioidaceae bacterium SCSIO 66511]|nr:gamma-glutamyl-gamma-aminobutyrate hydrolase family protein [Nocardioidaceae bacterium SCSIO 66511]